MEGKDTTAPSIIQSRFSSSKIVQIIGLFLVLGLVFPSLSTYLTRYFEVQSVVSSSARSGFIPSIEEANNLDRWIRPPSNLMHTMSDKQLFWRASLVPHVKKYPFKRVPKVAFMFLTRGPLPFSPLWEKFFRGHEGLYSIYIHALPSYSADFAPTSVFYRRQVPSQVTGWGQMSLSDAERRLLANALLDISNERFVLLSESCIPLLNFNNIYKYLMRSQYSFVGAFDEPGPDARGRYNQNMAPEVNITQWRKASQWIEVNRKLAVNIIEDTTFYPKFKEFCKSFCFVEEHYFPTMLTIQAPHLLANRSITWADWSRGGPHPATFGKVDITQVFLNKILQGQNCSYNHQPSSLCFVFARKFAPSALEPLLEFAPQFLGFD